MPLYMDIHIVPGVKARDVAEAHQKDLFHQADFACKCMTYWIDEERENIFCLIEAPDKQAVEEMHGRAHGLVPNKIIEVSSSLVESFLGRIYDPAEVNTTGGLKVFTDPSFRVLLVTTITDPVLLRHLHGPEKTNEWLQQHNSIIRQNLVTHGGREVEREGVGFTLSFESAAKAVSCAVSIHKEIADSEANGMGFKISLNAGEPVEQSNYLFGDTIFIAECLCMIAKSSQIAVAGAVKDLVSKDLLTDRNNNFLLLRQQDETILASLFHKLEENWQDPNFNVEDYCQGVAMSKSQLYRKTIALTGFSPNILLKEYRLEKARMMLAKTRATVSQVTFDCGFTSPSYFTKCFKKKYGLLPMAYLELV